jgi:hypothetical protein
MKMYIRYILCIHTYLWISVYSVKYSACVGIQKVKTTREAVVRI